MLKAWTCILLVIAVTVNIVAQTSYVKKLESLGVSGKIRSIIDDDDNAYIFYTTNLSGVIHLHMVKLNYCGEILLEQSYFIDNLVRLNIADVIITSDQKIFISLLSRKTNNYEGYLIKLDLDGSILFSTHIKDNDNFYFYAISENLDGSIFAFGNRNDPDNSCIINLSNSTGEIINQRRGIYTVIWGSAISTSDNEYLCRNGLVFYKVDSNYNIIWKKIINRVSATDKPIEVDDGFIYTKFSYGASSPNNYMFKINKAGDLIWQTPNILTQGFALLRQRSQNEYAQISQSVADNTYAKPHLTLCSSDGDILLERMYDVIDQDVSWSELQFFSDQSAFITSITTNQIIIIKTDRDLQINCDYFDLNSGNTLTSLESLPSDVTMGGSEILTNQELNVLVADSESIVDEACLEDILLPTLPDPGTLCLGDTLLIEISDPGIPFVWENGQQLLTRAITRSGTYKITYNLCNESITDQFNALFEACLPHIFIPDAFTPNDDGTNDRFIISTNRALINYRIKIYNRWGDQIFNSDDIEIGWDGIYKSQKVPAGIYIYLIEYLTADNKAQKLSGDLLVLR